MGSLYLTDNHIHSNASFDGTDSVNKFCVRAVGEGYSTITITDHFECNDARDGSFEENIEDSFEQTLAAKEYFRGKLEVLCGVELGQITHGKQKAEHLLNRHRFDFVLASLHNLRNMLDFYFLTYTKKDAHSLLKLYFEELIEIVGTCDFDSLAHLTYPLRYMNGRDRLQIKLTQHQHKIDEILKILALRGKALEVNTSGMYRGLRESMPGVDIIKLFKQFGGQYVTVGSDAHKVQDLGKGVADGIKLIQNAGFSQITVYKNRIPTQVDI